MICNRLDRLSQLLKEEPYYADTYLSQFRRSFMTPVPGLLVDLDAEAARRRLWPHGTEPVPTRQKVWFNRSLSPRREAF